MAFLHLLYWSSRTSRRGSIGSHGLAIHARRLVARARAGRLCFAAAAMAAAWLPARSGAGAEPQHAHVHGIARLGIAVEGPLLTLTLESPLDSLIGFEHRPQTDAEHAAVDALRRRMQAPGELFRFDAAAACVLKSAEARSAIFGAPTAAKAEGHADLDATFEYRCARPDRLSSADIGLFRAYAHLHEIDVEVATGKGQFVRRLTNPDHMVALVQ